MVQVGTREQLTKREAEQIEEQYRVELKANMNTLKCYLTEEQKQEQIKEQQKGYYEQNKEKFSERNKEYRETHKEQIKEKRKVYREVNREKLNLKKKEYQKKYREENKTTINEKVICECGAELLKRCISQHKKTKKHLDYINNN